MDWMTRLNEAMDYLEVHLTDEVDYKRLAQIACCSTYHFQRMFGYLAGTTLSEYVRRRRMSLAVVDLQAGEKIIDVATKYGYASPTAFNRAFQSIHGIAPSMAREPGTAVKSFSPIRFKLIVQGAEEMQYRVEQHGSFRIVGVSAPMDRAIEKNFEVVPQLWGKASMNGTIARLCGLMDGEVQGILGVSACGSEEDWRYFIAAATNRPVPEDMEAYEVPAMTWAIFPGDGVCPGAIQDLERRVVTEWLPGSGYEYANGPDLEVYLTPDPQKAKFEVWIPVVKKSL